MLAAPILIPGPAPALASLATSLPTTHRVITYTYPSTLLRTGDSLYRLTAAEHSTGEFNRYACDAVGNRLSLVTSNGSASYEYVS